MNLDTCFNCGAKMDLVRDQQELSIGERRAVVPVEHYVCSNCGEDVVTPAQMRQTQTRLVDELRGREGLLPPKEIRRIRADHSLTQAALERVLGVAPKTAVRWELGTVCQSRAIDQLLRLIDEVAGVLPTLAARAGVSLEPGAAETPARRCSVLPFLRKPLSTQDLPLEGEATSLPIIIEEALK